MLSSKKKINTIGDSSVTNSDVTQISTDTYINKAYVSEVLPFKRPSIIQEVLEGIIELSDDDIEATELDVQPYTIDQKIDHNKIVVYKKSYDLYMSDKHVIEHRLRSLQEASNPLASERLYKFIKRIYSKHCHHELPDTIIQNICEEIKQDLLRIDNMSLEDMAIIPSIVFYVFSKCHIFEKPPLMT